MSETYYLQNIRTLLIEGFTDMELRDLCFDLPDFKPVYYQLAQNTGKAEIVRQLLVHADQRLLLEKLLELAQQLNPARYEVHQPYRKHLTGQSLVGKNLGKYYITTQLSDEGRAEVYKAHHPDLSRFVAIKVIHIPLIKSQDFVERFKRKATAVSALRHPGIAPILDYDQVDDLCFTVMEFIQGFTLDAELQERKLRGHPVPLAEACRLINLLASAIDYAHIHGVIHGDLTPHSIVLATSEQPILTNFEIAPNNNGPSSLDSSDYASGLPAYTSPEEAQGKGVDERSDIYTLGVILYEILTGRTPFTGDTPMAVMHQHISEPPPLPTTINPEIPGAVERVVLKALDKQPSNRYQTAGSLANELRLAIGLAPSKPIPPEIGVGSHPPNQPSQELRQPIPRRPYKFLNAYGPEDATIFFGRDRDRWQLLSKIVAYRLVLLYGKSGTGKTSLIRAGLIPELAERGYHPVYARTLTNPCAAIATTVNATLATPAPPQPTLHAYLRQALQAMPDQLVLFIDQFEELFTQVDPQTRAAFIEDLGRAYADEALKFKIVLSLREDFLAELSAFKPYIYDIFYNEHRLERLTPDEAREAIIGPAALYGLSFEDGLIERILADLSATQIDPPQLQIVCDELYEALDTNEKVINARHYEQLGGARAILIGYLDRVLRQYNDEQQAMIRALLKAFITSVDTKAVLTPDILAQRARLPPGQVKAMLDELLRVRLVRRAESEIQFELAHEYLAGRIALWMGEQDRAHQQAQELLEQGLLKWQRFNLLLYRDELALIDAQRDMLEIDTEAEALLVRSAVGSGYSTDYWLERATPELQLTILQEVFTHKDALQRQRAATLAGHLAVSGLRDILAERMQADPDPNVRGQAALSLAKLDSGRLMGQLEMMLNGSSDQQQLALETVAQVEDAGSETLNLNQLARFNLRWRLRWLRLQRNRTKRNIITLYAGLGGAFGAVFGSIAWVILFGSLPLITRATMIAFVAGLTSGTGMGFGFGSVAAMGEGRRSSLYPIGAGLGGGFISMLLGILGNVHPEQPIYPLLGALIGLTGGILGGAILAIIINLTASILIPWRRLAVRLALAISGGMMGGMILALGAGLDTFPFGPAYGLAVGLFIPIGIIISLELAEQGLRQPLNP
ncbi:MAG: hypothetical protein BroJett011_45700 [Chloroflexota bacterium]|nr:MAG: hypothetical protein BroJett011_45700 [Chloroflexota bacterium]